MHFCNRFDLSGAQGSAVDPDIPHLSGDSLGIPAELRAEECWTGSTDRKARARRAGNAVDEKLRVAFIDDLGIVVPTRRPWVSGHRRMNRRRGALSRSSCP